MEIKWIFFTLVLFLLTFLRVVYIRSLCDDWNNSLSIYIHKLKQVALPYRERPIERVMEARINPWKYWWRLDCWLIKDIIMDEYLITDVINARSNNFIR